ncbi:MAG: LapA family protein [Xenococcaceae cyanobacterium MO_234.B1]|nr:LapA family protein [Xenococcaceae cyanobacterium MO_234.B1]
MFLIALRILLVLAIAYLFGLLVAWLVSLFQTSDDGGGDSRGDEPIPTMPSDPGATPQQKLPKKRLVEIDEYYYLQEFDLSQKKMKD